MSLIPILDIINSVVDRVIPDPAQRAQLQLQLAQLADAENARASQEALANSDVNKVEAGNRSVFVAGWRPAIGWGCGAALVYNTLLAPAFHLGVADLSFLQTVLLGMLGISASRTYEKVKGVSNDILPIFPKTPAVLAPTPDATPRPKPKILGVTWPF